MRIVIDKSDFRARSAGTQQELIERLVGTAPLTGRQSRSGASLHWRKPVDLTEDMAARLLHGARVSLFVGAGGTLAALALGLLLGALAGYYGGVTDGVMDDTGTSDYQGQLIWDLAHHCVNRMLLGMSVEAKPHNIAVITLMPGFMQTERVLMYLKTEALKKSFGFHKSESTQYLGRAVAALAADPDVMEKTGKLLFVADLAQEYGFTDVDGRLIPRFNPFD